MALLCVLPHLRAWLHYDLPWLQTLLNGVDEEVLQLVSGGSMVVMNKIDLLGRPVEAADFEGPLAPLATAASWSLSCKTGAGVDSFLQGLSDRVKAWCVVAAVAPRHLCHGSECWRVAHEHS